MTHGFEVAIHGHLGRHVLRQNNMAIDEASSGKKKKLMFMMQPHLPKPTKL